MELMSQRISSPPELISHKESFVEFMLGVLKILKFRALVELCVIWLIQ
jgi:hypothetical protein